ncbi:hypothetical protein JCM6882_009510 [Rhodosporidiobolus microsporus]
MASSSAQNTEICCAECRKATMELSEGAKMNRCTACKTVYYCSAEHQKANWKVHKPACASLSGSAPYILHIDFDRSTTDHASWCKPLLDSLTIPFSRTYALATKASQALAILDHPVPPKSILCTSAAIADASNTNLRSKMRQYIEKGGRLVLGGPLPSSLNTTQMHTVFADFGAPEWKRGKYFRTTHTLSLGHPLYQALPGNSVARAALPQSYSCKASLVDNVAQADALYQTVEGAEHQSPVPSMRHDVKTGEVAVAVKRVGEGWLAWIGDVNQEQGSNSVTLFLLGMKE